MNPKLFLSAQRDDQKWYRLDDVRRILHCSSGDIIFLCLQNYFPHYQHPTNSPDTWRVSYADIKAFKDAHDWRQENATTKGSRKAPWEHADYDAPIPDPNGRYQTGRIRRRTLRARRPRAASKSPR